MGEITVPKGVCDALGVKKGDRLVFEVSFDHAVLRRSPSLAEVREALMRRHGDKMRSPRFATEREGIEAFLSGKRPDELADLVLLRSGEMVIVPESEKGEARRRVE